MPPIEPVAAARVPSGQPLSGRVAIVTGGSRGIGKAIVDALLADGADVVAAGRSAGDAATEHLRTETVDLRQPDACQGLVARTVAWRGRLDILVNNAGVMHSASVEETDLAVWDETMAVNLRAAFLCSREAIPHLRAVGGGSIINIASINAAWAEPRLAAYCASKAGLTGLTRAIALDHGRDGIRCNAVCPGYVDTAMLRSFYDAEDDPEGARRRSESVHPLGRIATPRDIAGLVAWLVSDAARYVSGQSWTVDGGLTAGGGWELPRLDSRPAE